MDDTSALIEAALTARDWAMLIGRVEDGVFEAKGPKPYDFARPQAQYQLAKDASAFANADGGWIIVGLKHGRVSDRAVDVVEDLDLLAAGDFPADELKGRMRDFVRPDIAGLGVYWVENAGTPGMGVGVIHIPRQDADRKPYLIYHVIESDTKLDHIVFGYAERVGDASSPLSFEQIQHRMKTGMTSQAQRLTRMESQLGRIEGAVQSIREPATGGSAPVDDYARLRERMKRLLDEE